MRKAVVERIRSPKIGDLLVVEAKQKRKIDNNDRHFIQQNQNNNKQKQQTHIQKHQTRSTITNEGGRHYAFEKIFSTI